METLELNEDNRSWDIFGKKFPKSEVVFIAQVCVILIVIIACIYNLTTQDKDRNIWTALLASCLGYILPNPKIK